MARKSRWIARLGLIALLIAIAIYPVISATVSHLPSQLVPGTFQQGNYTFQNYTIALEGMCIGSDCRTSWPTGGGAGKQGDGIYLWNDTDTMYLNETKLNATIEAINTNVSLFYGYNASESTFRPVSITSDGALKMSIVEQSGLSGWVDDGITVRLATLSDRVGIGTASPTHELHVVGDANITGTVYAHNFSGNSPIVFLNGSGAEAMRIDNTGNVGIGTTSPGAKLDVSGTGIVRGNLDIIRDNPLFTLDDNNGNDMKLFNQNGVLKFYNDSNSNLISILQNGNVGIGTTSPSQKLHINGNINVTGGQITFPATQSASTEVNTLDDYEEGSFVVNMNASTSGTITLGAINDLSYTKIGRQVTVIGFLIVTAVDSPVGELTITGLPFAAAGGWEGYSPVSVYALNMDAATGTHLTGYIASGSTSIQIRLFKDGAIDSTIADLVTSSTQMSIRVVYFT